MLIVLPPSETKAEGGASAPLDLATLAWPSLTSLRKVAVRETARFSQQSDAAAKWKLGVKQALELAANLELLSSPTLPALERYTGVLYDPIAAVLTAEALERAATTIAVHSALFGLISGADLIPKYRLSYNSPLPGLTLKRHWAETVTAELLSYEGFVLDLRSAGYRSLGPLDTRPNTVQLAVLQEQPDGTRKQLNHFNKLAKGELTAAFLSGGAEAETQQDFLEWAAGEGFRIEIRDAAHWDLITEAS